jgi:hypothetical protein
VNGDEEVELEEAMGIASMLVAAGKVPAPGQWVDGMIEQAKSDAMEGFF